MDSRKTNNPTKMKLYQEAQTFINDEFFPRINDSRNSVLNIDAIIGDYLRSQRNTKDPAYYKSQPGVVHVTELSKCLRGVVLKMLGAVPDEELTTRQLGVFRAGDIFEEFVIKALGDKVAERQREYRYDLDGITLVGRSDFLIIDGDTPRIGEIKSVHSDSFWHRQKEGTLVAWQNQLQLQTYMWLERELNKKEYGGEFIYVSKDDCAISSCPVKYNPAIIENCVKPALEIIKAAYLAKDAISIPVPEPIEFSKSNNRWQRNWLCTCCDFHNQCVPGWSEKASKEVAKKNLKAKSA